MNCLKKRLKKTNSTGYKWIKNIANRKHNDFSQDGKFNEQNNLLEAYKPKIERKIILKIAKVHNVW